MRAICLGRGLLFSQLTNYPGNISAKIHPGKDQENSKAVADIALRCGKLLSFYKQVSSSQDGSVVSWCQEGQFFFLFVLFFCACYAFFHQFLIDFCLMYCNFSHDND